MTTEEINQEDIKSTPSKIFNYHITAESSSSRKRQFDALSCSVSKNTVQLDDVTSSEGTKENNLSLSSDNDTNERTKVTGCYQIDERVNLVVQRWGNVSAIAPDLFLLKLLEARGYETRRISAMDSSYRRYVIIKHVIYNILYYDSPTHSFFNILFLIYIIDALQQNN